jgi:hypothetical protein
LRALLLSVLSVLFAAVVGFTAEGKIDGGSTSLIRQLIPVVIAVLPVLLSPIVPWFLKRSGWSREESRMAYLDKRLDLLTKLHNMQLELKDDRLITIFDRELDLCRSYLVGNQPALAELTSDDAQVPEQSKLGRFFLSTPAKTTKGRVLKGFFYFFFVSFIFYGLFFPFLLRQQGESDWFVMFIGALFYLGLALIFRRWAKTSQEAATSSAS